VGPEFATPIELLINRFIYVCRAPGPSIDNPGFRACFLGLQWNAWITLYLHMIILSEMLY